MLIVTGTAALTDADGAREAMTAAVTAMVAATRAEEGCHAIRYAWDLEDPARMVFTEVYTDQAALQAHLQTDHMRVFYDSAGSLMDGRPDVTMYVDAEEGRMGGPSGAA